MSDQLSTAAQAVLEAFLGDATDTGLEMDDMRENVAAALRALATRGKSVEIRTAPGMAEFDDVIRVSDILSIAAELDGTTSGGD